MLMRTKVITVRMYYESRVSIILEHRLTIIMGAERRMTGMISVFPPLRLL